MRIAPAAAEHDRHKVAITTSRGTQVHEVRGQVLYRFHQPAMLEQEDGAIRPPPGGARSSHPTATRERFTTVILTEDHTLLVSLLAITKRENDPTPEVLGISEIHPASQPWRVMGEIEESRGDPWFARHWPKGAELALMRALAVAEGGDK